MWTRKAHGSGPGTLVSVAIILTLNMVGADGIITYYATAQDEPEPSAYVD
jgi:hypothetical protein